MRAFTLISFFFGVRIGLPSKNKKAAEPNNNEDSA